MNREESQAHSRQGQRKDYSTMHTSGAHRRRPIMPPPTRATPQRQEHQVKTVQQDVPKQIHEQKVHVKDGVKEAPRHIAVRQVHQPAPSHSPLKPKSVSITIQSDEGNEPQPAASQAKQHLAIEKTVPLVPPRPAVKRDISVSTKTAPRFKRAETPLSTSPVANVTSVGESTKHRQAKKKPQYKAALQQRAAALASWHPRLQHSMVWFIALGVLVMGGAGTAIWAATQSGGAKNVLPAAVVETIPYTVFAPTSGLTPDSADYDTARQMVSYDMTTPAPVTVSMQAMPAQFNDVPGYADRFFNGLESYKTFTSEIGKVHLTWRVDGNKADTAVINAGDTLIFISSAKELSVDTWKEIVTTLQAV